MKNPPVARLVDYMESFLVEHEFRDDGKLAQEMATAAAAVCRAFSLTSKPRPAVRGKPKLRIVRTEGRSRS